VAKRQTTAPAKYEGDLAGYKTKYLRCRGRRRHSPQPRGHFNIIQKNGKIMQFTEELLCRCGVRYETDYEWNAARQMFVKMGQTRMDYSQAPGYLFDTQSKYDADEARDELLTRELMASLQGDALDALFRTKGEGIAGRKTFLRAV
jgi:hypothetical protein